MDVSYALAILFYEASPHFNCQMKLCHAFDFLFCPWNLFFIENVAVKGFISSLINLGSHIVKFSFFKLYTCELHSHLGFCIEYVHMLMRYLYTCINFSKGSKSGASMKCSGCQGSGMKVSIRQLGPSMIQQMQHPCNECKGTGESISDKDRCPQCKGEKVVQEKKVLEVHVEKGMQNGQKITFPGEADEAVC